MTRTSHPSPRESGYTLAELLISTAIMVTVTSAIFGLMNPAQGSAQAQPEVADLQQRMRIGSDVLFKELVMTGAGPYQGPVTKPLVNFFASILPRRVGSVDPDPTTGTASFTTDRITLTYVPNNYSQTAISQSMPPNSAEMKVKDQPNCPKHDGLCGFETGMRVIIFDTEGHNDVFTITKTQSPAAHLQHRGQDLNYSYAEDSSVMTVVSYTFYLDRTTHQLKRYDGWETEVPLVDNVVDLRFDYFGDPNPPKAPKPPTGIANCIYDAAGASVLPTLTSSADGSLVPLTAADLSDGPYCGGGDTEFDADLLRIRKVRMTLRMQAGNPTLRGTNTQLFMIPGSAPGGARYVPDYTVSFEVTPRNLNLTR
jgi:hypothetical protein